MPGTTLATWNTNFRTADASSEVLQVLDDCQFAVFTEARDPDVAGGVEEAGWRWWMAPASSELMAWDPAIWRPLDDGESRRVHGDGPGRFMPGREVSWRLFRHKGSDTRHLFISSHVTAGYASKDDKPWREWRERAARRHLLTIVQVTAEHLALHPRIRPHHVHLLGDLNAAPDKRQEWWYPARLLDSLYRPDPRAGLDWIAHTRDSATNGLRVSRRWTRPLGAEGFHPAHFKRVTFPRPSG